MPAQKWWNENSRTQPGRASTTVVGQTLGVRDCSCVLTWTRREFWRSIQAHRQRPRHEEKERNKERCIRWSRRAASADVMTKLPPGVSVSVGRAASCNLPSRHLLVELLCADGGGFVFVRDPIPFILLPERLLGGRRRVANCALLRELNECVYGLNFLGEFISSGYLDVRGAASSGWAFAYQRIFACSSLAQSSRGC